jgi:hypothetical protein
VFAFRKRESKPNIRPVRISYIIKSIRALILFPGFFFVIISFTKCTKESEEERKEALILAMVNDIKADSLEADVEWLQNLGTRFALADNHRSVAVRIKNRFAGLGYTDVSLDSFLVTKTYRNINYEQWQYNVITLIRGTKYPDSLCIIGGHYDNNLVADDPFKAVPGANDNASGVAAMLEVARVMKKHNFFPESSIMFAAFGAEEIGLFGSIHIVSTPFEFSGKIRFMLNNDMIAYEGISDPYSSAWCVNIVDYDNSHNLRSDAEKICTKYTQLVYVNNNKVSKQSDSYPFYVAGYKALFFFSNQVDPNIHTLNDKAENYQFGYCSEIVKISCALLADKN